MIVCIAEDRSSCEPGIKLLLLSLREHCPAQQVMLFYPSADSSFRSWLNDFPAVVLQSEPVAERRGSTVKPKALLATIRAGHDDVLWIDSDIIVTKDFRSLVHTTGNAILVAEPALWELAREDRDALRARGWGFEVGRVLPSTANSCIVRVNRSHLPLLERWRTLLDSDAFRNAQVPDWRAVPTHMVSDQDVLTALLASREFAGTQIKYVKRGDGIIQYFGPYGYTTSERLRHLAAGLPAFVHSQGATKPWTEPPSHNEPGGTKFAFERLCRQLSPYKIVAATYKAHLGGDTAWMDPGSALSSGLRFIGLSRAPLVGLPVAVVVDGWRLTKSLLKRFQRSADSTANSVSQASG